jgi:ATP-dependent helicase/DNAse subunit B
VSWSQDGNALVIKKVAGFTDKVLPVFFKHHNLSSFIRQVRGLLKQLNMYNFSKVRSD